MAELAPALDNWKQLIDATLSPQDLEALNELRAAAAEFMAARKQRVQEYKQMDEAERKKLRETMRMERKKRYRIKGQMIEQFKKLAAISKQYPELVEQIKSEGQVKKSDMRAGALQIVQQWEQENATEIAAAGEHAQNRLNHLKAKLGDESVELPAEDDRMNRRYRDENSNSAFKGEDKVEDRQKRQRRRHRRNFHGIFSLDGPRSVAMVFL